MRKRYTERQEKERRKQTRELINCERDKPINKRKSEEDRREKYTTKNFHRKKKKKRQTREINTAEEIRTATQEKQRGRPMTTMGFVKEKGQFNIKPYYHDNHQLPHETPKTPRFFLSLCLSPPLSNTQAGSASWCLALSPLSLHLSIYLSARRSVSFSRLYIYLFIYLVVTPSPSQAYTYLFIYQVIVPTSSKPTFIYQVVASSPSPAYIYLFIHLVIAPSPPSPPLSLHLSIYLSGRRSVSPEGQGNALLHLKPKGN